MIVSGISYSRQQAMEKLQKKLSKYRQQVDEILQHIKVLLSVDPEYHLITQLQTIVVNTLQLANSLAPHDRIVSDNLRIQKQQLNQYKSNERGKPVIEFFETETELSQLKSQLGQIGKLLEIYANKGQLPLNKSNEYQAHLSKINIELTINSHMNQAKICADNDNITMYQMHIKQARDIIKKSSLEESDKNQRIKELTALLNEAKKTNKVATPTETSNTEPKPNE